MILTTTATLQGHEVTQYLGLVSGEAILGANIVKDIFASVTDIIGGRSGAYEKELKKAKEIAMNEMIDSAKELQADAIIGIDLDYETVGGGGMLMVSVSGTAITIKK